MNYQKLKEGKGGSDIVEDKIICLVGASGSGKTTLAKRLEKLGYNVIHSYTTRKPRYEGEWGHTFIKKVIGHEIKEIPKEFLGEEIIAFKKLYDYEYFATVEQYKNKGTSIYVVDPDGAEQVKENVKDAEVITIYLMADEAERRLRMHIRRFGNEKFERIKKDREIFKTCKCDYVVDANREVEDVLEDLVDIIE